MTRVVKMLNAILLWPLWRRQSLAMTKRSASSQESFIAHFPKARVEAVEVWNALREIAVVDGFPPDPKDDLLKMYGLVDDDLDEMLEEILVRLNYRLPTPEDTHGAEPVNSVEDAVEFLRVWRS